MSAGGAATPEAAWAAFAAAVAAQDAGAARGAATEGAWAGRGDSAAMVYEQAAEEGFALAAAGPAWIEGDRAVVPGKLERGGRSSAVYGLLERRGGAWGVSAGVREERQASLFLAGALPAVVEVRELGGSPEAERWARERIEEAQAAGGAAVKIVGVHALPARDRAVVGLERAEGGRPVQEWVSLDTSGGGARELGRSSYPSLGLLLTGVSAALPAAAGAEGGAGGDDLKVVNALLQALTEVARAMPAPAPSEDRSGDVSEALGQAIGRALEQAGLPGAATALQQQVAAASAAAGAEATRAPDARDALDPARAELLRELIAFRTEQGLAAGTSLLDPAFLAAHGQALSDRLLRVLAGAISKLRGSPLAAGPGASS